MKLKVQIFTTNSKVFETFLFCIKGCKMLRYGREFRELGEVYELDEFGLFDDWRLKAEMFEDFTFKNCFNVAFYTQRI